MENEKDPTGKDPLGIVRPALDWFNRGYDNHLKRYYGWDQRFYRFGVWTVVIILAAAVLVPTDWLARSSYRHYAEKNDVAQARSFLERGDYRNAELSARAALGFNTNDVAAFRVMARLAGLKHSPVALAWQQRIAAAEPTLENQLELAAEGLIYQKPPFPLTTKILGELSATATNNASYQAVAADLAMGLGQRAEAELHLEAATKLDPTNDTYAFSLSVLRLKMTNEVNQSQSRAALENLGTNSALGLVALRTLITERLTARDLTNANRYSTELVALPDATLADRLQNLRILWLLRSGDFLPRLQSVQRAAATNAPAAAEVSDWMRSNGLLAEGLQWLTNLPAGLQGQEPVRMALARVCLQSTNWAALRDLTVEGNWEDQEFFRRALLAHALEELGYTQAAQNNWDSAVSESGRQLKPLTSLYKLAEDWGMKPEQEDLLQRIVGEYPQQGWARQALGQFYVASGNTAATYQLNLRLNQVFPDDNEYKHNLAVTGLLLRTNLSQAFKWAAELHGLNPTNANMTATYAYALHLQGKDQEGLALLQELQPAQVERPAVALYYGILLSAVGKNEEAATWLQIARSKGKLLPEERQLLVTAQKGAKSSHP